MLPTKDDDSRAIFASKQLASHIAPYGKGIDSQTEATRSLIEDLETFESEYGPAGFPMVSGSSQFGLLEWLNINNVWKSDAQATYFLRVSTEAASSTKVSKGEAKRFVKNWSPHALGKSTCAATMLTTMVINPKERLASMDTCTLRQQWLTDMIPSVIRAGLRWTGQGSADTLTDFMNKHAGWTPPEGEYPKFWPNELWPTECAEEFRDLGKALDAVLYKTLILARSWDTLAAREREGVLLCAYGAASMLGTTNVLLPFAALGGEVAKQLRVDHLSVAGLADSRGGPSVLLQHTLALSNLVYPSNPPSALAIQLVSPMSRQLDQLMVNSDQVRHDLRAYRSIAVKRGFDLVTDYVTEALKGRELPKEGEDLLEECVEQLGEWEKLCGLNAHRAELNNVTDYWQKEFAPVSSAIRAARPFAEVIDSADEDEEGAGEDTPTVKDLQYQIGEAAARMDTALIMELSRQLETQRGGLLRRIHSVLDPIFITDQLREKAPVLEEASPTVSREEVLVARARIKELTNEVDQQRQLLSLHDNDETHLRQEIAELREQLHAVTSRNEALAHSLSDRPTDAVVPEAVLRGLREDLTLRDAVDSVAAAYANRVEVLPSVYRSLEGCGFKNIRKLSDCLLRLCGDYYDAIVNEGQPDQTARETLAGVYRPNESDSTMASAKLRAQREFTYNGETVLFEQHLTLGVKRGDQLCLQVYFKIIDRKLVIAYVGPHLDTSTT